MSVDLYERYKDALRRGHVAMARNQLEAALDAYREAIAIAPDRAGPHAGVGAALLRSGSAAGALEAFDAALARGPGDEASMRGRAEALAGLGRRTDAAETLDVLSEAQEAAARIGDATETTSRALDLAEQKARRRRFQELTRRLRLEPGDGSEDRSVAAAPATGLPKDHVSVAGPADRIADADTLLDASPHTDSSSAREGPVVVAGQDEDGPHQLPAMDDERALEPAGPMPDPGATIAVAEAALDAGDFATARTAYLAAAVAFDAEGSINAALDACYVALAFAPDDAELHLRLVELYLQRGWNGPAADKLALLGRLTELDGRQGTARATIVGLAADHFPDDPRLRRLLAQGRPRL